MSLPGNWFDLAILVTLVVPGIAFTGTRASLQGFRDVDRSVSGRVLQALVVSVIFDAVYVCIGWNWLSIGQLVAKTPRELLDSPQPAAVLVLVLGVVVPTVVSWLRYGRAPVLAPVRRLFGTLLDRARGTGYESTPTAWDWAPENVGQCWVRVRVAPEVWVGGKFGAWSFTSSYPEPRDLFIEEPWNVAADGTFAGPVPGGLGMWLAVKDDFVVLWSNGEEASTDDEGQAEN